MHSPNCPIGGHERRDPTMDRSLILLIRRGAGQGRGKWLAWEGGHSGKGNKLNLMRSQHMQHIEVWNCRTQVQSVKIDHAVMINQSLFSTSLSSTAQLFDFIRTSSSPFHKFICVQKPRESTIRIYLFVFLVHQHHHCQWDDRQFDRLLERHTGEK